MSTYGSMFVSILLVLYYIVTVGEAGPNDPWSYEEEKNFEGEFCDYHSSYIYKVCNHYGVIQGYGSWDRELLEDLSCQSLPAKLWSTEDEEHVTAWRQFVKCQFVLYEDYDDPTWITLSRGIGPNDVAEYTYDVDGWEPYANYYNYLTNM